MINFIQLPPDFRYTDFSSLACVEHHIKIMQLNVIVCGVVKVIVQHVRRIATCNGHRLLAVDIATSHSC
jgi:hypothetical protein